MSAAAHPTTQHCLSRDWNFTIHMFITSDLYSSILALPDATVILLWHYLMLVHLLKIMDMTKIKMS
jgi:hypothetical protein